MIHLACRFCLILDFPLNQLLDFQSNSRHRALNRSMDGMYCWWVKYSNPTFAWWECHHYPSKQFLAKPMRKQHNLIKTHLGNNHLNTKKKTPFRIGWGPTLLNNYCTQTFQVGPEPWQLRSEHGPVVQLPHNQLLKKVDFHSLSLNPNQLNHGIKNQPWKIFPPV